MDDLRAITALGEIRRHNRLRTDLDSYLFQIADWGLGLQQYAPNPKVYGLDLPMVEVEEDVDLMSIPDKAKEILKLASQAIELCDQIETEAEPKTEEAESCIAHLVGFNYLVKSAFERYESSIREIAGK